MIISVCHCDDGAAAHVHLPDDNRPRGNRHSQNIRIGTLERANEGLVAANEGYKRDLTVVALWITRILVTLEKNVRST